MKHVSVHTLKEVLDRESLNPTVDFINVCTPGEYAAQHIEGIRNVPLDELAEHLNEFKDKKTVYVHCRAGGRSRQAIETLQSLCVQAELINVEGGIMGWLEAGFLTK